MNLPYVGIKEAYLFPWFQTPADYEAATGLKCPLWDASKPVKNWFDPKAGSSAKPNVVYQAALCVENGVLLKGEDGNPMTDILVLPRGQAASVNIAPGTASETGEAGEIQCPLRPLKATEQIVFAPGSFNKQAVIRNLDAVQPDAGQFMAADRDLLQRIALKVGA